MPRRSGINPVEFERVRIENGPTPEEAPFYIEPTITPGGNKLKGEFYVDTDGYLLSGDGTSYSPVGGTSPRTEVALYDDFTVLADGSMTGRTTRVGGYSWSVSGSVSPTLVSGKVYSTGSGYLYTTANSSVIAMGADISFGGTGSSTASTLAFSRTSAGGSLLTHMVHCIIGPGGFTCTIVQDGGSFDTVMSNAWNYTLAIDGTTFPFWLIVDGSMVSVIGPGGEVFSTYDPRVKSVMASFDGSMFWQATTSGATDGYLHRVWALDRDSTARMGLTDIITSMSKLGTYRRDSRIGVLGGSNTMGASYVGPNNNGYPSIRFGGDQIWDTLTSAVAINDATFITNRPFPSGSSVTIGYGSGAESLTTTGYPTGTGPFTHTATSNATKVHSIGDAVWGTPAGSFVQEIYLNPANSFLQLPANTQVNGGLYIGTTADVAFVRDAAAVVRLNTGGSIKLEGTWNQGQFRMGNYRFWMDAAGTLRVKSSAPASDTDGAPIFFPAAVARTATSDGLTTGLVADGTTFVTVTSSNVNDIITLPTPTPGVRITLQNGATGYELRSSAPASVAINGGTGAAAESAIPASTTVECRCVTATAWICQNFTTAGVASATEVAAP